MQRMAISELSPSVQSFLAQVKRRNGILIEDEDGRTRYGVIPYEEAPPAQQRTARKRLVQLQAKVGKTMRKRNRTEAQFDRLLQQNT